MSYRPLTEEEHKAAGHFQDSTGRWIDPTNYVDTFYIDW